VNYQKEIKKLEERQDEIIESFTSEQQALIYEALNIEYKLTMAKEGHESELDLD